MILTLRRLWLHPTCVQGTLSVDDVVQCYTLEDAIREIPNVPVEMWKIDGATAIPSGIYNVVINWSNRFQTLMPQILDVPGFTGIRIHSGNTAKDTHGCVLVGETRETNTTLGHSHAAFNELMTKLETATDAITMEIINPPETVEEKIWT